MNDALRLEALETLHSPARDDGNYVRAVCHGCDADGWEAEHPSWPCQTAAILWPDPDEQAAVLADWHEWADPQAASVRARSSGGGVNFVAAAWEAEITRSLGVTSIYLRPGENHDR